MIHNQIKSIDARSMRVVLFVLLVSLTFSAHAGDLVVVVENIKNDHGNVRTAVFNNAKDFPKTYTAGQFVAAKSGTVSFIFKDLPAGQYAVSAIHDMNANGKLDTNFVGKPVEPYGFSREARGTFGPPAFEDAAIQLDAPVNTITIAVK